MSSVLLTTPIVARSEITTSEVTIIEVMEDYARKTISVRLQLSETPPIFETVPIWGTDQYNVNWTQAELEQAILEYYNPTTTGGSTTGD